MSPRHHKNDYNHGRAVGRMEADQSVTTVAVAMAIFKSCQEALVLQQCRRVCPKHSRSDLDVESMVITPYAVLFRLQESSSQDEWYEVKHYPALKEMNRQWLERKVQ
ncbi:hypothetical protein TNCV_1965571 [Trichonephila clavipes]|nr:hypothetical protein TNCV_1965571 [Trichonephila clavipes]